MFTANCGDIESNETPAQAQPLSTIGLPCFGNGQDDHASPKGKYSPGYDYYWVDVAPGKSISLDLKNIPADADFDLALTYRSGTVLKVSDNSQKGADELIPPYKNSGSCLAAVQGCQRATSQSHT